ncbi:MAG TPA: efflux RND transporter periplasmic adaptor subunit [Acetobacteraceae bacterium]|jgi:RND family efflux transporter MFP subunit
MTGHPESRDRLIAAPRRSGALARRAGLGLLMAASAVIAARLWLPSPPAEAQSAPPPPPPVTVSAPLQRNLANVTSFTGQFSAVDYVELRAQVTGYLTEIHFTDGQLVHKGDLLFVIDPRPYEIALEQAQAQFQTAAAGLDLANQELVRATQLKRNDFASGETVDQRVQQQRSAEATVAQAKAAIAAAQLNLVFTHITAPLTGRISSHRVSIGSLVMGGPGAASTTLLTTIVSLDPIYLDFDMSENDYLAYEHGRQGAATTPAVQAQLSDEQDWTHRGTLDFIDNQLDRSSGTIHARATLPNPKLFISPGEFARVRLPTSQPRQVLLVPDASVITDQSDKTLMTVAADGTVVPKRVQIGPLDGELRVIEGGLQPTDQVIINGLVRARPGGKVTPQPGTIAQPTLG